LIRYLIERVGCKAWAYTAFTVPNYEKQARVAHEQKDAATASAKVHSDDLAKMKNVAADAVADLEARKKYRRKRSASTRNPNPK